MQTKETVAKEFEEQFPLDIREVYLQGDGSKSAGTRAVREDILSFLHSQRLADLEAVIGMVEEGEKELPKEKCLNLEMHLFGNCFQCIKIAGYNQALSDLLAKLEEFKGKIR